MNILAIDPGATTGWALYDSTDRRVLGSGQFPEADASLEFRDALLAIARSAHVAQERLA